MRAGWRSWLVVVSLSVGATFGLCSTASGQAGGFPDLPGMDLVDEAMEGESSSSFSGPTAADAPADDGGDDAAQPDRMPAPEPKRAASEAASDEDVAVVSALPGGDGLPIIKELTAVRSERAGAGPMALLAAAVVVLFTRFLFRLNTIR